jgi:hypothetical protein
MFGSTVLDLAMGIIFSFLMISLVTSAVTEAIASGFAWRANTLLQGVKDLLNDQNFNGLALSVYNHAAVNARASGSATSEATLTAVPSYIDPKQFASALIDAARLSPATGVAALQAQVSANVADDQIKTLLNGIVVRTGGNLNRIRDEIADWFETGMDRVAGVYKRRTQLWGFLIGLALALALNVDTVKVAKMLWERPIIAKELTASPNPTKPEDAIAAAEKLGIPFGWNPDAWTYFVAEPNWIYSLIGWLMTAVATLFGAPFWFGALQKIVQVRGAGSK